jgi:hypothetical protein
MREFLAAVLTVIAMGVLLIAYSLSGGRAAAAPAGLVQFDPRVDAYQFARPVNALERVEVTGEAPVPYAARTPIAYPTNVVRPVAGYDPYVQPAPTVRRVARSTQARSADARSSEQLERRSGRDWKHTAMIVGGTTAAGAGVGAIVGGHVATGDEAAPSVQSMICGLCRSFSCSRRA